MGANCCAETGNPVAGFDNAHAWKTMKMVKVSDKTLEDNITKYPGAAPSSSYARRMYERPQLYHLVDATRNQQYNKRAFPKETGTLLPPYYINKYKAYYEGGWNAGQPTGTGKLYFDNGAYFEGPFTNGDISGEDGIYIYPDGSYKRGIIRNGKLEGFGKYVNRAGNFSYEGNWVNDQPNGKGTQLYPDGSSYTGNFVNGVKEDDNGVYRWANGKIYKGPFRDGYMNGLGELRMQHGKGYYMGQFSRNLKQGNGKMVTQTGEYQGPFVNGQMEGNGVFRWHDGKIYEGQFDKGQLHGVGTMYYPNGQMVKGVWHRGENLHMDYVSIGRSQIK